MRYRVSGSRCYLERFWPSKERGPASLTSDFARWPKHQGAIGRRWDFGVWASRFAPISPHLQSFEDSFIFPGKGVMAARQIKQGLCSSLGKGSLGALVGSRTHAQTGFEVEENMEVRTSNPRDALDLMKFGCAFLFETYPNEAQGVRSGHLSCHL